jgi:hypothetical protein
MLGVSSCVSDTRDAPPAAPATPPLGAPIAAGEAPADGGAATAPTFAPCEADHALPDLPLSAISVDTWADRLGRYRPIASSGRPTPFDGARAEVDQYLARVAACVERVFVGSFLESLRSLPADHPLSDPTLAAMVELSIDGETGALEESGIVSSSGVAEFDVAVVATFGGVLPVGAIPEPLLSDDGRFYVTWELKRDPTTARDLGLARAWKLRF